MIKASKPFPVHPYWIDFSDLYRRADDISHAYQSNNLVFFLGSGASKYCVRDMPDWKQLLEALMYELKPEKEWQRNEIHQLIEKERYLLAAEAIKQYTIPTMDDHDLAVDEAISEILGQRLNRSQKKALLHFAILDFGVSIVTTNFDTIVEDFIRDCKLKDYKSTPIEYDAENDVAALLSPVKSHKSYVFKLHGSVGKSNRLIFDEGDYSDLYFHRMWEVSLRLLRYILATKMVVFVGFSLSDPEIMPILREATRYSASYQHIALMCESNLTSIEKKVLRSNYKIDPIIYKSYSDIPLYIMEMRNFCPREGLPLHIRSESDRIERAIAEIRGTRKIENGSASVILFGSFVKYGYMSEFEADVDILFLTTNKLDTSPIQCSKSDEILERRSDITVMAFSDFEKLLRVGDPFASSVLITGCPISDPENRYETLARGFRREYIHKEVIVNMFRRYYLRWLRLCCTIGALPSDFLQAIYQWAITLIQLFILKDYYHLDLLKLSLLGNPRYAIHEFSLRYDVNEEFYLELLYASKGIRSDDQKTRATVEQTVEGFRKLSQSKNYDDIDKLLYPSNFLYDVEPVLIVDMYNHLSQVLHAMGLGKRRISLGYSSTDAEEEFLSKVHQTQISAYDYIFFFGLHRLVKETYGRIPRNTVNSKFVDLCRRAQILWKESSGTSFLDRVQDLKLEDKK